MEAAGSRTFPMKSGLSTSEALFHGLTAGLPDVGTHRLRQREVIRNWPKGEKGCGWHRI
jgi:hypothetical protein